MIKTVKDSELKDNQFKCAYCCVEGTSATACQKFERENNLECCYKNKHHYVEVLK